MIVKDQAFMRDALSKLCTGKFGHDVVAEAADGRTAVGRLVETKPDLILLGYDLPDFDGIEALERARRQVRLHAKVIVLSSSCSPLAVHRASRACVQGFVDTSTQVLEDLCSAIETVSSGKAYFCPTYDRLHAKLRQDPSSFDKILTPKEQHVVKLVGQIALDPEIAARLKVKKRTARWHLEKIMSKVGATSRLKLIRWAKENGFGTEPRPPANRN